MPTAFIQLVQTFCRVCQNQNQTPSGFPCVTQTGFSLSRPLSVPGVLPLQAWAHFFRFLRSHKASALVQFCFRRALGLKNRRTFVPGYRVNREQRREVTSHGAHCKATFSQSHALSLDLDTRLLPQRWEGVGKSIPK